MADLSSEMRRHYGRVLDQARKLAQQVRETAKRVHLQALETQRLTEIARRHSARGRELSRKGREEAHSVEGSIRRGLDTAYKAERRLSGKDEG
jgi:hypothetical protein